MKQLISGLAKGLTVLWAITVTLLWVVTLSGCPDAEKIIKPVVTDEPTDTIPPTTVNEEESEPIVNGEVGQPAEPEEPTTPNIVDTKPEIPTTPEDIEKTPDNFVGRVLSPNYRNKILEPGIGKFRSEVAEPVTNAMVTIVSGPKKGESILSNSEGYYLFKSDAGELHLRVEKMGYEPKEVIAHRSQPTVLANGDKPGYRNDPQENPGTILIGHQWPDEVRFILEEVLLVHDLLYIVTPLRFQDGSIYAGFYNDGMVVNSEVVSSEAWNKGVIAHELAHAHQHALIAVDGSGLIEKWDSTPEGQAFVKAVKKDWEEFGKSPCDTVPGLDTPLENAAETAATYWGIGKWPVRPECRNMKTEAPNRFRWAKEWLNK